MKSLPKKYSKDNLAIRSWDDIPKGDLCSQSHTSITNFRYGIFPDDASQIGYS